MDELEQKVFGKYVVGLIKNNYHNMTYEETYQLALENWSSEEFKREMVIENLNMDIDKAIKNLDKANGVMESYLNYISE